MSKLTKTLRKMVGRPPSKHAVWVKGPLTYAEDGLYTVHNADFMADPRFERAYAAGKATGSWAHWQLRWRVYMACWAAERACALDGDFVECGVNRGGLARAVIEYVDLGKRGKRFFLLDTFRGLVESQVTEPERKRGVLEAVEYPDCFADVQKTFAPFPFVKLVRGAVPDTLPQVDAKRVAYLSIDMNCVAPEIAAAEHFWDRLSPGAVIVLDDYGWKAHYEQKKAFDALTKKLGVQVLSMPTGQGLIFKP